MYIGTTAPVGWLMCDGSSKAKADYPNLNTILSAAGYPYGSDTLNFNVPDFQGRIPVGKGSHVDVSTLGNNDGASLANRRVRHQHSVYDPGHTHSIPATTTYGGPSSGGWAGGTSAFNTGSSTTGVKINPEGAASSTAPLDSPSYLVVNYIIKV
jgi:microcystin-dependent protein